MEKTLYPQLIQFSWAIVTLIFGAQGWLFSKEFGGNKKFKNRHCFLALAFIATTISSIILFVLFNSVLEESLKEAANPVAENLKCVRRIHVWSLLSSYILTIISIFSWISGKNKT